MREYREVRSLKDRLKRAKKEAISLKDLASEYNRNYSLKLKEIKSMEQELEKIRTSEIKVTEHAIVRYFERVLGFDIEAIEQKLTQGLDAHETIGSGTYPNDDFKVVVKNNHIVTVKL